MRWFLLVLFWCLIQPLHAQEIKTGTDKDTVSSNEQIKYVIRILGTQRGDIEQPLFTQFELLSEPIRSSQTRIVNGNVSQYVDIIYYIKPKRSGRLVIEPAKLILDGETYVSDSVPVFVSTSTETLNGDLLCRFYLDKAEAYVGQQIEAAYTVLNRYHLIEIADYDLPPNLGFDAVEIYNDNNYWLNEPVRHNGRIYREGLLKKEVIFARKGGEFDLGSFDLSANVGGDFLTSAQGITVTSNSQKIKIKPLPEGQPEGFSGGVGEMSYSLTFDKTSLKVNEPIMVNISVQGTGNVKFLDIPKPNFPNGNFEIFDADIQNVDSIYGDLVGGERNLSYMVIPRIAGEYDIDNIKFSYFSLEKEAYVEIETGPLQLSVLNPDGTSNGPAVIQTTAPESNEEVEKEERILQKAQPQLIQEKKAFFTLPYLIGILTPIVLFFLVLFGKRWYKKTRKDEATIRTIKASKTSHEHLKVARNALGVDSDNNFYDKIHQAIFGYLSDKLKLPTTELDQAQIKQTLLSKGVPESTVNTTDQLIERCLMARFAPVSDLSREEVLNDTQKVIDELEKSLPS